MSKTALSLYSGAGGLDLGIVAAGFKVVASVEQDPHCCATLRANGRERVMELPVEALNNLNAFQQADVAEGELELLFGGPPCQPFSKSAHWSRKGAAGLADPRAATLATFLQLVEQLRPRALLLENVEGFSRNGGLHFISEGLKAINGRAGTSYIPLGRLLNAAEFGVPQIRRRYFIVALRSGEDFEFPRPTHGPGIKAFATPSAAFEGLVPTKECLTPKGRWADLLPSIPEGKNYLWHTARGGGQSLFGWRTRYWSFMFKLARDKPSPTIVASPSQNTGPYHWNDRLLSTAEIARLQTFPPDYNFCGDRVSRQRQIGNAVPPLLAEHMGRALVVALGGKLPGELRYAIPEASGVPDAPGISPLAEKYLSLIGKHPDHPGTGKGPKGKATRDTKQVRAIE